MSEAAMPDDIYWNDSLAWSEQQADLLARLAQGERVNAAIDWEHVIEEVRDVGLSELRAVESLLTRALEHLLKLRAAPASPAANHWRGEVTAFLLDAAAIFTPAMRQRVDLNRCYERARQAVIAGGTHSFLPETCPLTMEMLLLPAGAPDVGALVARLA